MWWTNRRNDDRGVSHIWGLRPWYLACIEDCDRGLLLLFSGLWLCAPPLAPLNKLEFWGMTLTEPVVKTGILHYQTHNLWAVFQYSTVNAGVIPRAILGGSGYGSGGSQPHQAREGGACRSPWKRPMGGALITLCCSASANHHHCHAWCLSYT